MKNKYKLIGILIPTIIVTSVIINKIEEKNYHNNLRKTEINLERIKDSKIKKSIKEMVENLDKYFIKYFDNNKFDSFYLKKIDNLIISVWMFKNGEYFVQIYNEESKHKGTNIWNVSIDILIKYQSLGINYISNDNLLLVGQKNEFILSHKNISQNNELNFNYSINQPDISLMEILFEGDKFKVHNFVNRMSDNFDSYDFNEYNLFNPDFARYNDENYDETNFELLFKK